jgi:hypothetical protein
VPTPPIFWTVVVTKILAPDVVCAVAFSGPIVRLAIANKTPTEQRLTTDKLRRVKRPDWEFGFVRIREAAVVVVVVATGVLSQIEREVTRNNLLNGYNRPAKPLIACGGFGNCAELLRGANLLHYLEGEIVARAASITDFEGIAIAG